MHSSAGVVQGRMRAFPLLAVLTLLAAAMPAHADPGGSDAGDRCEDATDIPPGTYTGVASSADRDRFRVVPPAGQGVEVVVFGGPTQGNIDLRSDTGILLTYASMYSTNGTGTTPAGRAMASFPTGVRIGLLVTTGPVAYSMEVRFVDVADVEVRDVRVTERETCLPPLRSCPDEVPGLHASAELHNAGNLAFTGTLTFKESKRIDWTLASTRHITTVSVTLAPGSTARIGVDWTPTFVGEIKIHAVASADPNPTDNVDVTTHWAWVEVPEGLPLR